MEKKQKIRRSPYYYNASEWAIMDKADKKKYAKALVYDFLKKEHLLDKIYDFQTSYNSTLSKRKNISFKECLDYSIEKLLKNNVSLRDYFYNSSVMFEWPRSNCSVAREMEKIDKAWVQLIDNEIGR